MNHGISNDIRQMIFQLDEWLQDGEFGKPGDVLRDELDVVITLLAYVIDRIDDPARFLTLATKQPVAGLLMSSIHTCLLATSGARSTLDEMAEDAAWELMRSQAGNVETTDAPAGEVRTAV